MSAYDDPKDAEALALRLALAARRRHSAIDPEWSILDVSTLLGVAEGVEPGLASALEEMALRIFANSASKEGFSEFRRMLLEALKARRAARAAECEAAFDAAYEAMQQAGFAESAERAFHARPEEMGQAALRKARRDKLDREPAVVPELEAALMAIHESIDRAKRSSQDALARLLPGAIPEYRLGEQLGNVAGAGDEPVDRAVRRGLAQAERGETVDGPQAMERLRKRDRKR